MRTKSGGCCLLHNKFHYFGLIPVYSPECLMYRPGPVARLASKPASWLDIGQSIFLDGKREKSSYLLQGTKRTTKIMNLKS